MKIIKTLIIAVVILYLQVLAIPSISVFGNYFNILIPFIIFISSKFNINFALFLTFFMGISFDVIYPVTFGLNGIIFIIITFIIANYYHFFNMDNFFIVLIVSFAVNTFYYFIMFLFYLFSGKNSSIFSLSFVIMDFLNSAITVLFFFLYSFVSNIKFCMEDG